MGVQFMIRDTNKKLSSYVAIYIIVIAKYNKVFFYTAVHNHW